jgi:hypothetical protein
VRSGSGCFTTAFACDERGEQGGPEFQGIHSCTQLDGEALRLRDVTPWPSGDEPPAREDCRIELIVVATCGAGARK